MTAFEDFLPEVNTLCPTVGEAVAVNAIRNAAIEFCVRTHIWREDLDPTTIIEGEPHYFLDMPEGARMVQPIHAFVEQQHVYFRSPEELRRVFGWTNWREATGEPIFITRDVQDDCVRLVPIPQSTKPGALRVYAALAPTREATGVPCWLHERYLEHIARGAAARIYAQPGQSYSSAQLAQEYQRRFRHDIASTRILANKGGVAQAQLKQYTGRF